MELKKQRRLVKAVGLICEMLKITDKKLNDFIETGKVPELPKTKEPKANTKKK
jgi:hypothetical protein